jgi:hypothetical protein
VGPGRRQDILVHPFFAPVDWPAVDAGAAALDQVAGHVTMLID